MKSFFLVVMSVVFFGSISQGQISMPVPALPQELYHPAPRTSSSMVRQSAALLPCTTQSADLGNFLPADVPAMAAKRIEILKHAVSSGAMIVASASCTAPQDLLFYFTVQGGQRTLLAFLPNIERVQKGSDASVRIIFALTYVSFQLEVGSAPDAGSNNSSAEYAAAIARRRNFEEVIQPVLREVKVSKGYRRALEDQGKDTGGYFTLVAGKTKN